MFKQVFSAFEFCTSFVDKIDLSKWYYKYLDTLSKFRFSEMDNHIKITKTVGPFITVNYFVRYIIVYIAENGETMFTSR